MIRRGANALRTPVAALATLACLIGACAPERTGEPAQGTGVEVILQGAARATGVAQHPGLLQVSTDATVQGPGAAFRTVIHSSSDGRVRMEQIPFGFVAGSGTQGDWRFDPETGTVGALGGAASFVVGHELHLLALRPEARLSDFRLATRQPSDPAGILAVAGSLPTGDSIVLHFAASDTLPIGLRVTYTEPHVLVSWSDWEERAGLRIFTQATFAQGEEMFEYSFEQVDIAPVADSLFEPPQS